MNCGAWTSASCCVARERGGGSGNPVSPGALPEESLPLHRAARSSVADLPRGARGLAVRGGAAMGLDSRAGAALRIPRGRDQRVPALAVGHAVTSPGGLRPPRARDGPLTRAGPGLLPLGGSLGGKPDPPSKQNCLRHGSQRRSPSSSIRDLRRTRGSAYGTRDRFQSSPTRKVRLFLTAFRLPHPLAVGQPAHEYMCRSSHPVLPTSDAPLAVLDGEDRT
jgi:hypothetical protein